MVKFQFSQIAALSLAVCTLTTAFAITASAAQPAKTTTRAPNPIPSMPAPPNKVLTNDEFSHRLQALNQQTQATLSKETNAALPKQPLPTNSIDGAHKTANTASTINAQPMTMPTAAPTPTIKPAEQPQAAPAQPTQQQTYTGFGAGKSDNNTNAAPKPKSNAPAENSGGWNINY